MDFMVILFGFLRAIWSSHGVEVRAPCVAESISECKCQRATEDHLPSGPRIYW